MESAQQYLKKTGSKNIELCYDYATSLDQEGEEEWNRLSIPENPDSSDKLKYVMLFLSKYYNANIVKRMDPMLTKQELASDAATKKGGLSPLPSVFVSGITF